MDSITFSIIMPCYNSETYVADAVESLLKQTYYNWELIVVNDGSTDNTLDILNNFADKDKRIKVYSKKNGGYATAINFGLDRIAGDYFLMLGSDDRFSLDLLSELEKYINEKSPDIIAFRAVKYLDKKPIEIDSITDFESVAFLPNSSVCEYEKLYPKHSKIMFIRDTAKCYKTSLLGNLRYFGKYGYDSDGIFSTLFTHKCHSFMSLPVDGYYWTKRDDSVSATVSLQKNVDRIGNWKQYYNALIKEKNIILANQEKKYVTMAFGIGCQLLNAERHQGILDILKIHRSIRKAIKLSKKYSVSLMKYDEIFDGNCIKRMVFLHLPIVFIIRHGFLN